jgi:DNA-binding LytR/AlgR family response regulator
MMKAKLKSDTNQKINYIAFQTLIGLRFINKESVVYFEFTKDDKSERSLWKAHLENAETIKLKLNTTSKDIIKHFENHDFIQISQSYIVNLKFFSSIELKSRKCALLPPYEEKEMIISRAYLNEIKCRFEIE